MASAELRTQTLWALDLDRNLIDTNVAFKGLVAAGRESGMIDEAKLRATKENDEKASLSFNPVKYLLDEEKMTRDDVRQLMVEFKAQPMPGLIFRDAQRLLHRIDQQRTTTPTIGLPFILTKGDELYQVPKTEKLIEELRTSSYRFGGDLPYIFTDRGDKGIMIDEHAKIAENGKRYYEFAMASGLVLVGQTVTLVEDYYDNTVGIPNDCYAYVVDRPNGKVSDIPANRPRNVELVASHDYIYVPKPGSF